MNALQSFLALEQRGLAAMDQSHIAGLSPGWSIAAPSVRQCLQQDTLTAYHGSAELVMKRIQVAADIAAQFVRRLY